MWPADLPRGANAEEAKEVVLCGDLFLLSKKLENDIEHWTEEDTRRFLRLSSNWRARTFFGARKRFTAGVDELKRIHQETGSEPRDLGLSRIENIRESLKGGYVTLLEIIVVRQPFFNSIVGLILIIFAVCYIGNDMPAGF